MIESPTFASLGLSEALVQALKKIGFEHPTEVQTKTIPPILEGKDIFAQSKTGSGKTGSFAIPTLERLLNSSIDGEKRIRAVVLSPTRELAQQTHDLFKQVGVGLGFDSHLIIGGENIEKQKDLLSKNPPDILVATPGRLCDLNKQRITDLSNVEILIFDEADRLFDMGFKKEIQSILAVIPYTRQLIMVSATTNMDVMSTAYQFKSIPEEIKLSEDELLVDKIDHKLAMLSRDEKMPLLVKILRDFTDPYALVFCNTQIQTHLVAEWLKVCGFAASPISGGLSQNKRTRLMEDFRSRKIQLLVCTDVAARGLDINDVNLVINYDLPQDAENYVHRIGRTGRAGKSGEAISFCAHEDCENLESIYKYIDSSIPKLELTDEDFAKDIPPKPYIDYKTLQVVESRQNTRKEAPRAKERSRDAREGRRERQGDSSMDQQAHENFRPQRLPATSIPTFYPSQSKRPDSREFVAVAYNDKDVENKALGYFQVGDSEILDKKILKKGLPRFILFGARKCEYLITLKPIYKRVLQPYLEQILSFGELELNVNVSFKNGTVTVRFWGPDEGLLMRNRRELLFAFEHLSKTYIQRKVKLPKELRWNFACGALGQERGNEQFRSSPERRNDRGRGTRPTRDARPRRFHNGDFNENGLLEMAKETKEKILNSGETIILGPYNSKERRVIHQFFSEQNNFTTHSIGEGPLKKIEVGIRA